MSFKYSEKIYAGVLGKIIGVYLGRPVEGWSYEKINSTFGEIPYYVHKECNVPLIVADDDISGTFGFFRALEDYNYKLDISAKDIGNTWLNYIIEDKTILWWGGLGRSTEHTAYLNLKNGINAPISGSIKQNGRTLAEQIGAQIFIDAFAMAFPDDPEKAVNFIRKAASVSHDGIAVEAACFLGAMESMAFEEKNIHKLMDNALKFIDNKDLILLIEDVRNLCEREKNWRLVREYLDPKYGYGVYPGCCHVIPNHAMVLASILLGEDDFQKSIKIASSAAWDTDCNAGNVGALNGIRLGLSAITEGADFRGPVADKMLVVTSDGGSCVTDAVREAKRIIKAASYYRNEKAEISNKRFDFSFKGSMQGFSMCPYSKSLLQVATLKNDNGLMLECYCVAEGANAEISTPTFLDFLEVSRNFSTIASPTLYSTQNVFVEIKHLSEEDINIQPYILHYDIDNNVRRINGECFKMVKGDNIISWKVPNTDGMPIFRLGFSIKSIKRFSGNLIFTSIDWKGAPEDFSQKGMLMTSIWNTNPYWLQTWSSSAKHFAADFKYTYCVSHPSENGASTIGADDWINYSISSKLCFSLHKSGGLLIRTNGHRRYYAAIMRDYKNIEIIKRYDDEIVKLSSKEFKYEEDIQYKLEFRALGNKLQLFIDGIEQLVAEDNSYKSGGAGFVINNGTMTCDGFFVSH